MPRRREPEGLQDFDQEVRANSVNDYFIGASGCFIAASAGAFTFEAAFVQGHGPASAVLGCDQCSRRRGGMPAVRPCAGSLNSSASLSVIAPASSSASVMVTARL